MESPPNEFSEIFWDFLTVGMKHVSRGKGISFDETSTSTSHNWRWHGSLGHVIMPYHVIVSCQHSMSWIQQGERHQFRRDIDVCMPQLAKIRKLKSRIMSYHVIMSCQQSIPCILQGKKHQFRRDVDIRRPQLAKTQKLKSCHNATSCHHVMSTIHCLYPAGRKASVLTRRQRPQATIGDDTKA